MPEHRVGIEDREIVGLARLQPPRDPQRERRVVDRGLDLVEIARLHRHRQLPARAEDLLKLPERNDGELVLRLAEQRAAPGADADDAEMHALDLDDLVERIDIRSEQPFGVSGRRARPTGRGDVDFGRADQPSALGVVVGEIDVFRRHARHLRRCRSTRRGRSRARGRATLSMTAETSGLYRLTASASCRRDARVRLHPQPFFVAADDAELLDDERVGARLVEDGAARPRRSGPGSATRRR